MTAVLPLVLKFHWGGPDYFVVRVAEGHRRQPENLRPNPLLIRVSQRDNLLFVTGPVP